MRLRLRTIMVTHRAAWRQLPALPDGAGVGMTQRALELLDGLAPEVDSAGDEQVAAELEQARAELLEALREARERLR